MPKPKQISEAKRKANRENAKRPRQRPNADLREQAKRILGPTLAGPAFERINRYLSGEEGGPDQFRWAVEFVSGRIGLPVVTQQQVDMKAEMVPEVVEVAGGLGWPGVAGAEASAAGTGDHDGRHTTAQ